MPPKIVSVEISGTKEFLSEVNKIAADGKRTVGQLLFEAATMTHKMAVDSIRSGTRAGTVYFKTKAKIPHQASAPGEPPKSDTGTLLANLTLQKEGKGYTVGSRKGAPWGFWLEFGTSRMGARPWLTPAFDKMMNVFSRKYK